VLVFDGVDTEWVEEWTQAQLDQQADANVSGTAQARHHRNHLDFCASAFNVKASLLEQKLPLTAEFRGHPRIAKWADQRYQIIVL
jgi:hypothetical protein